MDPIYVTGHRNPDTDSIVSAMAYAALRNALGDREYRAARLGHVSDETQLVLDRFGFPAPVWIKTMRTQVRDLDYDTPPALSSGVTISRAWAALSTDTSIAALPITNEDGTLFGMLSSGDIAASDMQSIEHPHIDAVPLFNVLSVLEGRILNEAGDLVDSISGDVCIALPQSCDNLLFSGSGSIIVCGHQPDMVRRAISKKKAKEIEKERQAFVYGDKERGITGCVANGIEEATAQAIYDEIFDFANYAFNKAHAVSYAVVAYQTAYFKCHYTKEYMAALLTSVLDNSDKVAGYIGECRECGIALLPPDVNRSYDRFTVEPEGIRFGLVAIKNIGRGFIQSVVREREQRGFFRSFQDFCQRMYDCGDMNKRAVENLIRSGTFDSLGDRRSQLIAVYETVLDAIGSTRRQNVEGQLDMFGGSSGQEHEAARIHLPDIPEYSATERMHMEKETTGLYLSGHPMTDWRPTAQRGGAVPIHEIMDDFASEDGPVRFADGQNVTVAGIVTSSRTRTTKNNTLMAYVVVEDETAAIELLCFSRTIDQCGSYMAVNTPVLVKGRLSVRDEKPPQIMCDSIYPLEQSIPVGEEHRPAAPKERSVIYLRVPSMDSREFRHISLVMTMFEGDTPLKVRVADTGKMLGTTCLDHPAFLQECREWLGQENVVVRKK